MVRKLTNSKNKLLVERNTILTSKIRFDLKAVVVEVTHKITCHTYEKLCRAISVFVERLDTSIVMANRLFSVSLINSTKFSYSKTFYTEYWLIVKTNGRIQKLFLHAHTYLYDFNKRQIGTHTLFIVFSIRGK